jgi:dolichyl-phosphate-mannose--protein O-mannosyl transferase
MIARGWGGGIWSGLLCAAFFLFDNLNLVESRLVLIDSQLIFWCAFALMCAQKWWARLTAHDVANDSWQGYMGTPCDVDAERSIIEERAAAGEPGPPGVPVCTLGLDAAIQVRAKEDLALMMGARERAGWCFLIGVACSSCISIKWTGLATPGMIAVESFFGFFFLRKAPAPFLDLLFILLVAFCCYYTWFVCHFALLPKSGDGDAFMKADFQRTLIGNSNYDPLAPHPGYWRTFFDLNQEMLRANARIDVRHNWESYWYEWPLNLRGLLYYSKDQENTYTRTVYLLGNPIVIWAVAVGVLVSFGSTFFYLRYKGDRDLQLKRLFGRFFSAVGFCLWTYILNLLPYILVARSAFIYHYMPALMYGEIMTALMLEQLVGRRNMHSAAKTLLILVIAAFLFYAPWVYSWPLTNEGHARRRLLKRWD